MSTPTDNFKINLNQNLWGLISGFSALGIAEHFNLRTLYWLGLVLSVAMLLSVLATTFAYTRNYWDNKRSR